MLEVPMDHDLSRDLLELKAQFDTWRRTRRSPRAKTPDDLLQAALAMCDRYPARLICRVCRISSKTFSRATASTSLPKKRRSKELFFKLPPISQIGSSPLQINNDCRIQLERPDGSRLTLTISTLDPATLNSLCLNFLRS
jgi:hypothetical protein